MFLSRHRPKKKKKTLGISFTSRLVQGPLALAERRHPPRPIQRRQLRARRHSQRGRQERPCGFTLPCSNTSCTGPFAPPTATASGKLHGGHPAAARCRLAKFRNENLMKKLPLVSAKGCIAGLPQGPRPTGRSFPTFFPSLKDHRNMVLGQVANQAGTAYTVGHAACSVRVLSHMEVRDFV